MIKLRTFLFLPAILAGVILSLALFFPRESREEALTGDPSAVTSTTVSERPDPVPQDAVAGRARYQAELQVWADAVAAIEAEEERARQEAAAAAREAREAEQAVITQAAASRPIQETVEPRGDIWWELALCESGGTNANTGNGYYGYFQFHPPTWRSLGYSGLPTDYGYDTQLQAAQELQARSGWGQWPACSRRLGLR